MAVNLNVDESEASLIPHSKFGNMNPQRKRYLVGIICVISITLIVLLSILFSPTFLLRGPPKQLNVDSPPNIVFIMADDLGWANVGFHNGDNAQIATPRIDRLARDGLQLNRMYVYRGCAPTRSAFQSGRLPVHATTDNDDGIINPLHGMPAEMTSFAQRLKEADYATYLLGKWDAGFASWAQMPSARGWDYFYGYLGKTIDYFYKWSINDCSNLGDLDLWENGAPAFDSIEDPNTAHEYVEFAFRDRALDILDHHIDDEGPPFVIFYSSHLPHYPTHVPEEYIIDDPYDNDGEQCSVGTIAPYPEFNGTLQCRTLLQSQVNLLDEIVGQIHDRLVDNNLWDNTLLIFQSDNGGHVELSHGAGNNYPLRGGKMTDFEGGVRAVTFVNGGWLPDSRRGQVENGLMHIADWYATFCALANVDPSDSAAVRRGLPDIDSVNLVPVLLGDTTESPRTELIISTSTLISLPYKVMTGGYNYAIWGAPVWPDGDTPDDADLQATNINCQETPCVFNIIDDESERYNLAEDETYADLVEELHQKIRLAHRTFYENDRVSEDSCPTSAKLVTSVGNGQGSQTELGCGCWMALHNYGNFDGPYTGLTDEEMHFDVEVHEDNSGNSGRSGDSTTSGNSGRGGNSGNSGRTTQEPMEHEHEKVDYSDDHEHEKIDYSDDFEHEQVDYADDFSHDKVDYSEGHEHEKVDYSEKQGDSEIEDGDFDIAELVEDEEVEKERSDRYSGLVEEMVANEERARSEFHDILVLHDDNTYDVYKRREEAEEKMLNGGRAAGVEPRTGGGGVGGDLVYFGIGVVTVVLLALMVKCATRWGSDKRRQKSNLLKEERVGQMSYHSYGSALGL